MNSARTGSGTTDGRNARRERNVAAVLEAEWALLREGRGNPSWEAVAARAKVSLRTLQRFFPDREQLILATLRQQVGPVEQLHEVAAAGQGDLPDRVTSFVAHRIGAHHLLAPVAHVAVGAADLMPLLTEVIADHRAQLRSSVETHFAPELEARDGGDRQEVGDIVDLLCQPESIETLRVTRGMDSGQVQSLLTNAVTQILAPA